MAKGWWKLVHTKDFVESSHDKTTTEKRDSIGQIKPTDWHTVKYGCVEGKYLYNRCHLIGYKLTVEKANKKNLITGARYLNIDGMLPLENMLAGYIKETYNHVLYRMTSIFDNDKPCGFPCIDGNRIG